MVFLGPSWTPKKRRTFCVLEKEFFYVFLAFFFLLFHSGQNWPEVIVRSWVLGYSSWAKGTHRIPPIVIAIWPYIALTNCGPINYGSSFTFRKRKKKSRKWNEYFMVSFSGKVINFQVVFKRNSWNFFQRWNRKNDQKLKTWNEQDSCEIFFAKAFASLNWKTWKFQLESSVFSGATFVKSFTV